MMHTRTTSLPRFRPANQETIVLLAAFALALLFAATLDGFSSWGNIMTLLRSVSILGILALGMIMVIIIRGIDLSQVAIGMVSAAIVVKGVALGYPLPVCLLVGLPLALSMGLVNSLLVDRLQIPALFVTLTTVFIYVGLARVTVLPSMIINLPPDSRSLTSLAGNWHSIPIPLLLFLACALAMHLFLARTTIGRFFYAYGDNPETARLYGMPVRIIPLMAYMGSALLAFLAGLLMVSTTAMADLKTVNSTLIFDVILVVVVGGASFAGARGSVASVIAGLLLVGVLLNAMTIMDINSQLQNIIKGAVLLVVLVADKWLYPFDEESSRQSI
ncbi:ABC transporter permease [Methylobacillus arboreus]|uniref:ABC transporter permease n=1 Tax=Methylobacillus arboreus TaxID=755170 RepID=UPI001E40ABFD|nr:ABC transporter permease [Methylobacillus arboreus]MCB5190910.1 ABC transporter permease [Methylobacillus arboreus]